MAAESSLSAGEHNTATTPGGAAERTASLVQCVTVYVDCARASTVAGNTQVIRMGGGNCIVIRNKPPETYGKGSINRV